MQTSALLSIPASNTRIIEWFKLTAFGGTFLTTLPIFAIITNSYTIKLKLIQISGSTTFYSTVLILGLSLNFGQFDKLIASKLLSLAGKLHLSDNPC